MNATLRKLSFLADRLCELQAAANGYKQIGK
ncbi:hypothetical protein ICNINCKA_00191 [Synechococcus sp. CBW1107]|nr:hypothetical protein ICNINCKA_00191 [Synechococcus sp. CBW1107]